MAVHIRPLREEDAHTSVHWRNIPEIWAMTGSAPSREIRIEDEIAWIRRVIADPTGYRFAIMDDDRYVGNIYLTDVRDGEGEYHIFLGERSAWGKGVARAASEALIAFARDELRLQRIRIQVRSGHDRAIALYAKLGFRRTGGDAEFERMLLDLG